MSERKKQEAMIILPMFICLIGILFLNSMWRQEYRKASYLSLSAFSEIITENNPEYEEAVLASLKEYQVYARQGIGENRFLESYGYTGESFWGGIERKASYCAVLVTVFIMAAFLLSILYFCLGRKRRTAELTDYLEKVNTGTGGTLLQTREDAFSHLQDEIYKTVTNLYTTREKAVRAKESFADNLANIAHQLKTPLTAALLSLQLMEKNSPNRYAKPIGRQLERLTRLEESLLTLSRIDSGTLKLEALPVDVYTVLNLAAENLGELLEKRDIHMDIPDKGCVEFCGDREWTMEALLNLVKNCIEHSPQGGTIHCDYSENPLYVEILVWDEGEGFDREDIPYLFKRFYRGNNKLEKDGIGIGLALASSLFELQNGSLTARNLPSGGACFEIHIYCHRDVTFP